MRDIVPIIEERRQAYEQHPFIRFLKDEDVPASRRLAYAPYVCHFVMTFAEVNGVFLSDADNDDPHQQIVNRHAEEDAHHWPWFLRDLKTLGYDMPCSFVDVLRFVWNDAGRHTREMGYYTIDVARNAEPKLRLVIIEALESMGNVWLEATMVAARQHPQADKLIYFGQHHMDRETGHAIGASHDALDAVVLSAEQHRRGKAIVHGLYDHMERFNGEVLSRSQSAWARNGTTDMGAIRGFVTA